jgi:phage tail-like protein
MDSNRETNASRAIVRPYAAGRFAIEVDGNTVGYAHAVDGGAISADVVTERVGLDSIAHKHLAGVKYEDLLLTVDLSLDPLFYAWIADTLAGKVSRKDVVVYTLDANNKIVRQAQYFNALVSEVGFPGMDAASKDTAYMTVKFAPEYTRFARASGKVSSLPIKGQQKKWLPSNFRLEIDGLDGKKVSKVDAFTVKQSVAMDTVGERRDYKLEPTSLEFPNLTVTLAEASAQTWQDWFDDFVVKGNNGPGQEKSGSLTFLAPDQKTNLAQIDMAGLGIFRLAPDKVEAGSENIRRVKAELYVERMALKI